MRWPKYWSCSFSINPSNEYSGLISFRMDWPRLTLSTSSFQSCRDHNRTGQQGREGAAVSRGGEGRWGTAVPQSPGPCPSSRDPRNLFLPLTLPNVLPTIPPGAEAGGRSGVRGRGGSDVTVHPVPHATCGEGGQPAGKSCLGFSYRPLWGHRETGTFPAEQIFTELLL